jgi:transposase
LPSGNYHEIGFETDQVVDIKISRIVTEYRAQILENEAGDRVVAELFEIPTSAGTLYNFNRDAYQRMNQFDLLVKHQLTHDPLMHVDETRINIGGTRMWLHSASNLQWTYFYPHQKRGFEAMDEMAKGAD